MNMEYNIEEIDNGVIIERRENNIKQLIRHKPDFGAAENEILEFIAKLRNNNNSFELIIRYEYRSSKEREKK